METETLFSPVKADDPATTTEELKFKETKEERIARQRLLLQNRLANHQFDSVRVRAAYILNRYPVTRDNDVELAIHYWQYFHANEVGSASISFETLRSVTKFTDIVRSRQTIQNTFKLFVADDAVTDFRDELASKSRQKHRAIQKEESPYAFVYADESGKSGKTDKYLMVGGIWINDVDGQMVKLTEALNGWRDKLPWTEKKLHLSEASKQRASAYTAFVKEAVKAAEYVGLKAVVVSKDDVKKRHSDDSIFQLYYRLIVDGMEHEVSAGRCVLPRKVVVVKDQDAGTDKFHLKGLRDRLRTECRSYFDNQVDVLAVEAMKSQSSVLLQLADVFTGAINRVLNRETDAADAPPHFKDELADEVLTTVGLDPKNLRQTTQTDFASIIWL